MHMTLVTRAPQQFSSDYFIPGSLRETFWEPVALPWQRALGWPVLFSQGQGKHFDVRVVGNSFLLHTVEVMPLAKFSPNPVTAE